MRVLNRSKYTCTEVQNCFNTILFISKENSVMLLVPCRINPYSTWHRAFVMLLVLELKSNELWLRRCKVINGFKIYLGL